MKNEPTALIASLDLFARCSRTERALIERLATVVEVGPNVELCTKDQIGQTFYVLARGEATVAVDDNEIATLGPGCGFGEIALLRPGGRRIATVTTSTPTQLVLFSRPEFATLMAEVPSVAHQLVAECRRQLDADGNGSGPFATS